MKILVINGPNLNMLGLREPGIYGTETYASLVEKIQTYCDEKGVDVSFYQSNHEGDLVDEIQKAYGNKDAIVINPGAYTHTSIAILDAVKATGLSCVEVHISNVHNRETYRHHSFLSSACHGIIVGFGMDSYRLAIEALINLPKG